MCCCAPFWGYIPPMSLQNPKFPSKLKSTEMADETELFYTPVSKVVVFATLLVSVSDLHKGLSSFVFPVKQITQNPPPAMACRFESGHRHQHKSALYGTDPRLAARLLCQTGRFFAAKLQAHCFLQFGFSLCCCLFLKPTIMYMETRFCYLWQRR